MASKLEKELIYTDYWFLKIRTCFVFLHSPPYVSYAALFSPEYLLSFIFFMEEKVFPHYIFIIFSISFIHSSISWYPICYSSLILLTSYFGLNTHFILGLNFPIQLFNFFPQDSGLVCSDILCFSKIPQDVHQHGKKRYYCANFFILNQKFMIAL